MARPCQFCKRPNAPGRLRFKAQLVCARCTDRIAATALDDRTRADYCDTSEAPAKEMPKDPRFEAGVAKLSASLDDKKILAAKDEFFGQPPARVLLSLAQAYDEMGLRSDAIREAARALAIVQKPQMSEEVFAFLLSVLRMKADGISRLTGTLVE